jgi:PPOX class probable F420-dependent enzyme
MAALLDDRQIRFVQKPRIGRLVTIGRDGAPHVAPIWYRYEDGAFLILTDRKSQKHRNIERDPRVVLCIDDERPPYHYVIVRGRAAVGEALGEEWRLALAVHYLGEEQGRRYVETTSGANGILVRVEPESVTTR